MKKNKKLLSVCCIFLMPLCSCSTTEECEHTYVLKSMGNWSHNYVCEKCGLIKFDGFYEHTWIENANGDSKYICKDCGQLSDLRYEYNDLYECGHEEYKYVVKNGSKHEKQCYLCGSIFNRENHQFRKNTAKESENKEPTCTEAGWEWQICECGFERKIDFKALNHSFTVVTSSTTATCTEAGENTTKCSRCGADNPEKQPGQPLGHLYENETTITQDGYINLKSGTCCRDNCNQKRISWSARDVNANCENNKREIRAPSEENPEGSYEPNYTLVDEENGGITFWGRPIHNSGEVKYPENMIWRSGSWEYSWRYDANVVGSFLEYTVNLSKDATNLKLVADMRPLTDMNEKQEVFNNVSVDVLPGFIDSADNRYPNRYVVTVDGAELEYLTNTTPNRFRDWYTFPYANFNLDAGEHTIRITMAGGHVGTFYNFGLESADII